MEYRVYTYTPRAAQTPPRRRRRRAKRRRGAVPTLGLLVLLALPLALLLTQRLGLSASGAQGPAGDPPALPPCPTAPADPEEERPASGTPSPSPSPSGLDGGADTPYDYSMPVPASGAVEDSYFDDAVFIGDSRTEGLILNTGLYNAATYAYKGLMVDTVFTKPFINQNGGKVSVMDALPSVQFSKVYIMLGINETGWVYSQIFQQKYGELIDAVRAVNPDAVIYIQEIMPVSAQVSSTHSYITNEKIQEYNGLLRELAADKQVYFLDTGAAVAGGDGALPEDAAADGIHLVKAYCEKWLDYLKTHTASK